MRNFTILTPFSKQVTQDYNNVQKKEIELCCKSKKLFIEKSLHGYCNILSEVSQNDNVYFLLPPCFDENKIKVFVEDLIVACRYLDVYKIVFDKTRCDVIESFEKKRVCDEIEFMLLNSEIPITLVTSNFTKQKNSLRDLYTVFDPKSNSSSDVKNIHKNLHEVYDLKEAMFLSHFKRTKSDKQLAGKFCTGSFSYALN